MKIIVDKKMNNGKSKSANTWTLDFFPYGDNSGATTVNIVSLSLQQITIFNGLFDNGLNAIKLIPDANGVISFTFTATGKGQIVFSDKKNIIQLGRVVFNTANATHIFSKGSFNSPCVFLDLQNLPQNIEGFILNYRKQGSRTFVNESYNELVKYSKLKGFVLGNTNEYPLFNFTNLSFNSIRENKLSFIYIENVYVDKNSTSILGKTSPINDKFFINPILTKNSDDLIAFISNSFSDTDNKNVVVGKMKEFGKRPYYLEWNNSLLIEGKISDISLNEITHLNIGGSKIKGYDAGRVINDLLVTIDISRTGMSDLDTDKFLIDLNNSLVTNLRRTLKIKARTSATDSIVSQLITKGVVLA